MLRWLKPEGRRSHDQVTLGLRRISQPHDGKIAHSQEAPPSDQAKRIEDLVNRAAALVDRHGRAAFDEFRKRDSQWWFGNTYLFAYDDHLNVLLNPAFPKREGTNPHGEKDVNGKMFHDEFLTTAQTSGAGWVDYMFPKPGQTQVSHKWSYVKGF